MNTKQVNIDILCIFCITYPSYPEKVHPQFHILTEVNVQFYLIQPSLVGFTHEILSLFLYQCLNKAMHTIC